jgi:hypothetical protein
LDLKEVFSQLIWAILNLVQFPCFDLSLFLSFDLTEFLSFCSKEKSIKNVLSPIYLLFARLLERNFVLEIDQGRLMKSALDFGKKKKRSECAICAIEVWIKFSKNATIIKPYIQYFLDDLSEFEFRHRSAICKMLCSAVPFIEEIEIIDYILRFCWEFVSESDDLI